MLILRSKVKPTGINCLGEEAEQGGRRKKEPLALGKIDKIDDESIEML
jgi:hypothetical protein